MQFKQWFIKEEAADRERQLDKSSVAQVKPVERVTQLSRYGYLKKNQKKS
jgi:hypothetical protein